ncbi:MAG: chemotaxis protein CheC [Promethearchaeota archaeon]
MLETESEKNINVVIIRIKKEKYLLEVSDVKEIYIPGEKIVPIPLAEKSIVGIIDIRGEIYSIISLRRRIYTQEIKHEFDELTRILLLEMYNLKIAILVDAVIGVREVPTSIFKERSTIVETDLDYQFIKSVGVLDNETYILLDLRALIARLEIDLEPKPEALPDSRKKVPILTKTETKAPAESEIVIPRIHQQKPKVPVPQVRQVGIMPVSLEKKITLTPEQEDMLKEVGNIGSGNAVTALSRLIQKKIDVSLTNVGIISFDNLPNQFGGPTEKICGIFSQIEKTSQSTIFQVFEMRPLMNLIASLAGNKSKIEPNKVQSKEDLDDFAISTITEMGHILAGHYASALADLMGTKIMIDVPEFALSDAGALGEFLSKELKSISTFVILIKTSIKIVDLKLNGVFFFIPDLNTLYNFFRRLGIAYEPQFESVKPIERTKPMKEIKAIDLETLKLTEIQQDALKEIGNIGAGNAANALAQMINTRVTINVPTVELVELDVFAKRISKKNEKLFVSWSNVTGKTRATILSLFKVKDILKITSILVDDKKQIKVQTIKTINNLPELYRDAISELGHILASHYVSALGDLLNIRFMTEPPDMSLDKGNQLFKILSEEIGLLKKLSLVITTNVIITDIKILGTFLFIPNVETLHELLDALEKFYD